MSGYRTSKGRKFHCIEKYFQTMPVGMRFNIGDITLVLLQIYQQTYPDGDINSTTWVSDSIRTLSEYGDVLTNFGGGQYKLSRAFNHKKDYGIFVRHYTKKSHPGRQKKKRNLQLDLEMNEKQDDTSSLSNLGATNTKYRYDNPGVDLLETFTNQFPERDYITEFVFNEFTSLCPKTHQPDFAVVRVTYIADKLCIETKSLKTYFLAYRNHGSFMETLTNKILEDCVTVCAPRKMVIESNFNARGGTLINVTASYEAN